MRDELLSTTDKIRMIVGIMTAVAVVAWLLIAIEDSTHNTVPIGNQKVQKKQTLKVGKNLFCKEHGIQVGSPNVTWYECALIHDIENFTTEEIK